MKFIQSKHIHFPKLLPALGLLILGVTPAPALEGMLGIHDPSTVIKCDGNYYVYGTGRGISVLTSSNGFSWQRGERVIDRIPESVKSFMPENDGQSVWAPDIIKLDGKFSLYYSSDNPTGPYKDEGLLWPDNEGGKGHNVTALVLPDGSYAVVVSETRPGDVFASKSLDGPWKQIGSIKVKAQPKWHASNVCPIIRPDGGFEIIGRSGDMLISTNGSLGPYVVQGQSIYPQISSLPQYNLEDPVIWYSGGLYHITVNCWSDRKAFLLTSPNGITDWTNRGLAYDPTKDFLRYSDGTVNHWNKIERPGIYMENGQVIYFTFAVIDVPKEQDRGNMLHGSKVIVAPFDGAALDRDLQNAAGMPSPPSPSAKHQ